MNIQDHLAAFDHWLTSRIEEAHAGRKDLAFRDLAPDIGLGENSWEYCLLEPGARSPQGEGWSVYRLQGAWPESRRREAVSIRAAAPGRKSFLMAITDAFIGREHARAR